MKRFLVAALVVAFFVSGCAGSGGITTGVGSVSQSQDSMAKEWEAYYEAKEAQAKAIEVVKVELDEEGRIKSLSVNQAPEKFEIMPPKRQYSAGWETANRFVDGFWSTAKMAVPVAGVAVVADVVGRRIAESQGTITNNNNSNNSAGGNYAGADHVTGDAIESSYNPIDNSDQGNPVNNSDNSDNSNQGNPIDNSDQGNPVDNSDNRSDYDNPVDSRTNYDNPVTGAANAE